MKKWPYLVLEATKQKNKGTLFSRTFKVRENKVPLLLSNLAFVLSYDYFITFTKPLKAVENGNQQNYFKCFQTKLL